MKQKIRSLFNLEGRLKRKEYAQYGAISWAGIIGLYLLTQQISIPNKMIEEIVCILIVTLMIGFGWLWLTTQLKRCHDIGWSGWQVMLGFIPLTVIPWALFLLIMRGESKENEYDKPIQWTNHMHLK